VLGKKGVGWSEGDVSDADIDTGFPVGRGLRNCWVFVGIGIGIRGVDVRACCKTFWALAKCGAADT
jgi:hypothetical protein